MVLLSLATVGIWMLYLELLWSSCHQPLDEVSTREKAKLRMRRETGGCPT